MVDDGDRMKPFGYSDVDGSGREDRLRELLQIQAAAFERARRERFDRLGPLEGAVVLDVGCGLGEVVRMFAARVGPRGRVIGIDLSEAMLSSARTAAAGVDNVEYRTGNAGALEFDANTFDLVHSERVFMHLEDPQAAVDECVRVLKPGGRLMIVDPDHMIRGTDGSDPEALEILWRAMSSTLVKNPRSGRRLRGQFLTAGLVDVAVDARLELQDTPLYGVERQLEYLRQGLRFATEQGLIDVERGEAAIADTLRRIDEGRHLDALAMFTVVGTKPH